MSSCGKVERKACRTQRLLGCERYSSWKYPVRRVERKAQLFSTLRVPSPTCRGNASPTCSGAPAQPRAAIVPPASSKLYVQGATGSSLEPQAFELETPTITAVIQRRTGGSVAPRNLGKLGCSGRADRSVLLRLLQPPGCPGRRRNR